MYETILYVQKENYNTYVVSNITKFSFRKLQILLFITKFSYTIFLVLEDEKHKTTLFFKVIN